MTRIGQRKGSDCVRCCVAMALGFPYEDVPDFVADHPTRWLMAIESSANERGLGVLRVAAAGDGELLHEPSLRGVPWIASGPTERGTNHAVVYIGSEPFHDPHASRAGLISITAATVFVRPAGRAQPGEGSGE